MYIAFSNGKRAEIEGTLPLSRAQSIVGGYVEAVYPRKSPSVVLLVDEEGLCKSKPLNQHGCDLYGGVIVGDIIVMSRDEARKGKWL